MDWPQDNGISWPERMWPDLGFGLNLPVLTELTALVRSLGGYLLMPGQDTYIAQDSAWPQTALPVAGTIGYVGDVGTQGMAENFVTNSVFSGATVGTPGSVGTGYSGDSSKHGLTRQIIEAGNDYLIMRVSGVATATSAFLLIVESNIGNTNASPGQLWAASTSVALVAGAFTANKFGVVINEATAAPAYITNSGATFDPTATNTRYSHTRRLSDVACARVYYALRYVYTSGENVDFTIRISQPQLNRGNPIAYTPTYGTAVSRPHFASAAQSTTAACPILRGKVVNLLQYSQDFSNAWWAKVGSLTIPAANIADPIGGNTASHVVKGVDGTTLQRVGFVSTGQVKSIWARTVSGTGTIALLGFYGLPRNVFTLTTAWQRFQVTSDAAETGGTTFYAVDFRGASLTEVYIWGAQLEVGSVANTYVPTTTAPASLNAAPYWAEYDGLARHLITGIPTPSTGYVCVVGRQDSDTSAYRAWLGSSNYNKVGVSIGVNVGGSPNLFVYATAQVGTSLPAGTYIAGTPAIIEGAWTPNSQLVRFNGGVSAQGASAADVGTPRTIVLGARNSADFPTITPSAPITGPLGATIIIPNLIPTQAQQDRIVKLAAQIYGIPGVQ